MSEAKAPKAPAAPRASNEATARANELQMLLALVHFGYLTTAQLGAWVWLRATPHVQVVQAQRLTKRLETAGQIIGRKDVRGHRVWVLTKPGAARVRTDTGDRIPAIDGYHLRTDGCNATHDYAVTHLTKCRAVGQIVIGKAGLRLGIGDFGHLKGLDGIVAADDQMRRCYGILGVTNSHEMTVDKYKHLAGQMRIKLLGEPWAVKLVKERAGWIPDPY